MRIRKPKVLIFASGSKDKGGSGLLHLILNILAGVLPIEIVGVVSNYENGGVRTIADKYGIRFIHMTSFSAADYARIAAETGAEWFLLSGWLKKVCGLDPSRTINIHPGPTDRYGGDGMYGHYVHDAIIAAGEALSAVTMHFVDADYDRGPTFFVYPVSTSSCETGDDLGALVNRYEHGWQSFVTWLVISGQISWSGRKGDEVRVPLWYRTMPFCPARLRVLPWWYRLLRRIIG
jgi:phosphoribosylglycinamide formyltransferase-1